VQLDVSCCGWALETETSSCVSEETFQVPVSTLRAQNIRLDSDAMAEPWWYVPGPEDADAYPKKLTETQSEASQAVRRSPVAWRQAGSMAQEPGVVSHHPGMQEPSGWGCPSSGEVGPPPQAMRRPPRQNIRKRECMRESSMKGV
jgi:hypothetical protein